LIRCRRPNIAGGNPKKCAGGWQEEPEESIEGIRPVITSGKGSTAGESSRASKKRGKKEIWPPFVEGRDREAAAA